MAARFDVQRQGVVHDGAAVVPVHGLLGEAGEHVQFREDAAVLLDGGDAFLDMGDEVRVQARLNLVDTAFRRDDFLFVLLQLLGDVALRVDQRLFADPLRRNLVLEGVANLDIVTENVVVSDSERGNSGALGLALLHLQEVVLAAAGKAAKFVQVLIDTFRDDRALADLGCGIRVEGVDNLFQDFVAAYQAFHQAVHRLAALADAVLLQGLHLGEAAAQLQDLPRERLAVGDAAEDAVQVAEFAQFFLHGGQGIRPVHEELHDVVALVEFLSIQDGHGQPAAQHAGAHRRGAAVYRLHQGNALAARRGLENFQVPEGERVHPDDLGFVDAAEGRYVP